MARSFGPTQAPVLWVLLILQTACAVFFLWDILSTIFGFRTTPISWRLHEILEIAASIGLVLGAILGVRAVQQVRLRAVRAEQALKTASGAFAEVVETQFQEWGLTAAEHDVAWFSIKGFSSSEIAAFRGTSEGTIKAQSNAIYRKAGVSGRPQITPILFRCEGKRFELDPAVKLPTCRGQIALERTCLSNTFCRNSTAKITILLQKIDDRLSPGF